MDERFIGIDGEYSLELQEMYLEDLMQEYENYIDYDYE